MMPTHPLLHVVLISSLAWWPLCLLSIISMFFMPLTTPHSSLFLAENLASDLTENTEVLREQLCQSPHLLCFYLFLHPSDHGSQDLIDFWDRLITEPMLLAIVLSSSSHASSGTSIPSFFYTFSLLACLY